MVLTGGGGYGTAIVDDKGGENALVFTIEKDSGDSARVVCSSCKTRPGVLKRSHKRYLHKKRSVSIACFEVWRVKNTWMDVCDSCEGEI